MQATLGRKLRFSDAVYGIATTPKALRNWLQRKQVVLLHAGREGGWLDFRFDDIAILALVRKFVDFGIGVETANALAHKTLGFFPDHLTFLKREDALAGVLASPWSNRRLLVWPEDDKWKLRIRDLWREDETDPSSAFIVVDVEAVLGRAFERATESNDDGIEAEAK